MCELLGMSANVPTDICFSFAGLLERGGRTGPHRDGWGITFYEGAGSRSFKDPNPSSDSSVAQLVKSYPIKSQVVISHIRQANVGNVSLENTHPFERELWGKNWTYAHNGQLKDYLTPLQQRTYETVYQPVGSTDSEWLFCWLLNNVRQHFENQPVEHLTLFRYIATLCPIADNFGVFNILLSDGCYTLAYCSNNLHWITRRAPFGRASLIDVDVTIDFQMETTPDDVVTVITTRPLTDNEDWVKMLPGEWAIFKDGRVVERACNPI